MRYSQWLATVPVILFQLALSSVRAEDLPKVAQSSVPSLMVSTDSHFNPIELPFEKAEWNDIDQAAATSTLQLLKREMGAGYETLQGCHYVVEQICQGQPDAITRIQFDEQGDMYRYHKERFEHGLSKFQELGAFDGTSFQDFDYRTAMLTVGGPGVARPIPLNDLSISMPFEFLAKKDISQKISSVKDLQAWLGDSLWLQKISHLQIAKIDGDTYYRFLIQKGYDHLLNYPFDIQVTLDAKKSFYPVQLSLFDKNNLVSTMNIFPAEVSLGSDGNRILIPDRIVENYYRFAHGGKTQDIFTTDSHGRMIPYAATCYTFKECRFGSISSEKFMIDPSIALRIHDLSSGNYIQVPR